MTDRFKAQVSLSRGMVLKDSNGDPMPQQGTGGAAHVLNGASGDYKSYILDPDDGDAENIESERIQDIDGFRAFRVTPLTPGAIAGVLAIIYGWSTSAGDLVAVNVVMAAMDVDITTPGGAGQEMESVRSLFPIGTAVDTQHDWSESPWIVAAGETIKTIAVRSTGDNYTKGVLVEVIK